jgi:hypothetical protein
MRDRHIEAAFICIVWKTDPIMRYKIKKQRFTLSTQRTADFRHRQSALKLPRFPKIDASVLICDEIKRRRLWAHEWFYCLRDS